MARRDLHVDLLVQISGSPPLRIVDQVRQPGRMIERAKIDPKGELATALKAHGVAPTARGLAGLCALDPRTAATLLAGQRKPHGRTLSQLAAGLGVDEDTVLALVREARKGRS